MQLADKNLKKIEFRTGSALILAVVLTSLLAVVGVIFIMAARVEKVAASSISENRELNFAIETVVAKISQELALDVPGVGKNQEYYDYPGPNDIWLASLEPYEENGQYYWKQISDVTGFLDRENWDTQDIRIGTNAVIKDREKIELDSNGDLEKQLADADGDGVADAKWIELDNITSGKGKPVYAAIRIIDNGGMLNVNTAYKFDANETDSDLIDGSSQTQINLLDLSERGANPAAQDKLDDARFGSEPQNLNDYIRNVVWRYYLPDGEYTPFDMSDELELRNRFLLNHLNIDTRIEKGLWANAFEKPNLEVPVDTGGIKLTEWFYRAQHDVIGPNDIYSYRHIATTYNTDRIIKPDRLKMVNINKETNVQNLYDVLVSSIARDISSSDRRRIKEHFAQLAVNMVDYVDGDIEVTAFEPNNTTYYGFEAQPFISEVAMKIDTFPDIGPSYFAVELYNPFDKAINLENFELELYDSDGAIGAVAHTVTFDSGDVIEPGRCFVIANNLNQFDIYGETDENTKQDTEFKFFGGWTPPKEGVSPRDRRRAPGEDQPPRPTGWQNDTSLRLKRKVEDGEWVYIDKQFLDRHLAPFDEQRAYGRDARDWHIIYQTLEEDEGDRHFRGSLGRKNDIDPGKFTNHNFSFFLPKPINPDPPLRRSTEFVTVGDITRILTIGNSTDPERVIGEQLEETLRSNEDIVRLDLQNPYCRNIFQYLTVFDPTGDRIDNDGDGQGEGDDIDNDELKIAGRININTAPWFVIKQLPWVTKKIKIAQAIVAYRDKLAAPVDYKNGRYNAIKDKIDSSFDREDIREAAGFETIGELNFVIGGNDEYSIAKYALDGQDDLQGFPDLTTNSIGGDDGVKNDFEERDIIFSRISNLVTVRSDVFTAYILVRIGADGPQKRVIALLDRSNVYTGNSKVKVIALHPVPDPR